MSKHELSRRDFLLKSVYGAALLIAPGLVIKSKASALSYPFDRAFLSSTARLALIIDDVGFSLERTEPFLRMNVPLTFSILPHLPYSRYLAEKIHDLGHEIMLHQPMEPHNTFIDPGPGALFVSLTTDSIGAVIERNIKSIPYASGCNNHMGSRYTELRACMQPALTTLKEQDFFFVDSLTSNRSIAFDTARALKMHAAYRHVFIDNVPNKNYVYAQLHLLKKRAQRLGSAIGIGHPRPDTAAALKKFLADLQSSDIRLTYISNLVRTVV